MTATFPRLRVGDVRRFGDLEVFPLFPAESASGDEVDYRLAAEALADGTAVVSEVSAAGSVPELFVENRGDRRILFLEGEQLLGAKQNRILNTSVLIAAGAKTRIPVSCVEQRRWRHVSEHFAPSDSHSHSSLRHKLKRAVSESVARGGGHRSDQGEVWRSVAELTDKQAVASPTGAMEDVFAARRARLEQARAALPYDAGAVGLAAAVRGRLRAVEFFDKPATCERTWGRLVAGLAIEAAEAADGAALPVEEATRLLEAWHAWTWSPAPAVGEGEELRTAGPDGSVASALALGGVPLHASLAAAEA